MVLSRRHIIPSTRYTEGHHSGALAAHLSSMIPPVEPSRSSDTLNTLASSVDTIKGRRPSESKSTSNVNASGGANFLGLPSINVNVDVKKWNWPGYLTFGKGSSAKPQVDKSSNSEPKQDSQDSGSVITAKVKEEEPSRLQVEINPDDLEDAMTSDSLSTTSKDRNGSTNMDRGETSNLSEAKYPPEAVVGEHFNTTDVQLESDSTVLSSHLSNPPEEFKSPSPPLCPEFSMTNLNLAPFHDPTSTRRVAIHYYIVRSPPSIVNFF